MEKAVLFDVDGTIVDTVRLEIAAWRETLRTAGFDVPAATIRKQMGKGPDQLLPTLLPGIGDAEIELLGTRQGKLFRARCRPRVRPFPHVADLFRRLRAAGFTLGLASSGDRDDIHHYERLTGIAELIDVVACGDDAQRSKPAGDIFFAALRKLNFASTAKVLVVGDTPYDAQAAYQAGLATVGVLGGAFDEAELRAAGCIAVFRDTGALLERFDETPFA